MTALEPAAEPEQAQARRWSSFWRHSFPRFVVSGAASAGIDTGLLILLHGVLGMQLLAATFLAVSTSFGVNFALNRLWSFGSRSPAGAQLARYLVLAGLNWALTVAMVGTFVWLGLNYILAKLLTTGIMAILNYFAYDFWVFRDGRKASS